MDTLDMRTRRRRAALATVGVHVAMAGAVWMLPEPPPPEPGPPQWARTEVVLLGADTFEVARVDAPNAESARVEEPGEPAAPPPDAAAESAESAALEVPGAQPDPARRDSTGGSSPSPSPSIPPPTQKSPSELGPAEGSDRDSGAGLALSGLRGSSRARAPDAGALRPPVVVPTRPPAAAPVGPVLPPRSTSTSKDRSPRSLAEAGFKRRKDGSYRYRERGVPFKATIHPNGRIEFSLKGTTAHKLGMADALRSAGGEELFAAAKKRLLAETLELRMTLAQSWAREQMQAQLQALRRQLLSTWQRREWSAPRRREEIFTLWDDCEESLSADLSAVDAKLASSLASSIDRARAKAGTQARAKIVSFINRHLPHDSADAYTAKELRTFNATRHSKRRFEPYAKRAKASRKVPPAPEPPVTPPGAE